MIRVPFLAELLSGFMIERVAKRRPPDFIVGLTSDGGPYLLRWYLTPWRRTQTRYRTLAGARATRFNKARAYLFGLLPNLYLHKFCRDDDDRALHDHPSWACSLILSQGYIEHTIAAGGIHHRREYRPGDLRFLPTRHTHRIELLKLRDFIATQPDNDSPLPCWTLFLFGPTLREWGFHCPVRGWVHWREFTAEDNPGEIGPGCGA